jgi:hypothetical protein
MGKAIKNFRRGLSSDDGIEVTRSEKQVASGSETPDAADESDES